MLGTEAPHNQRERRRNTSPSSPNGAGHLTQSQDPHEEHDDWIPQFLDLVRDRKMSAARELGRAHADELKAWPIGVYAPTLMDAWARLLDRNGTHFESVAGWVAQFRKQTNIGKLETLDTTHLNLAEAIIEFHSGQYPQAIEHLHFARPLADECEYDDLQMMTRYYLARALYRTGAFAEARSEILQALSLSPHRGPYFDLLMVQTWILFSQESVQEAKEALDEAIHLLPGRDYIDAANVASLQGRFARQEGDFVAAADYARQAIGIFEKNDDQTNPLLARALVHWAFALLLKLQDEGCPEGKEQLDLLRRMAFDSLRKAQAICGSCHKRILDRVHYFRASWHLDLDELKQAKAELTLAFDAARAVNDYVIMAHVRILQCQCARKQHAPDDAARLALEAQDYAEKTDNRRVRARSLIWRSMIEADPPRKNYTIAQALKEQAGKHLRPTDRDYVHWEFSDLEEHLKKVQGIENRISFPVLTIDEVQRDRDLDRTLTRLAICICEGMYKRAGSISETANQLGIGRDRLKKLCPHLKDLSRTSGLRSHVVPVVKQKAAI